MKIEVSIGEIVDKATILAIKLENFKNPEKRANVQKELNILLTSLASIGISAEAKEFKDLKTINRKLWDIEDRIRIKESEKSFDDEFIKLARSVYFTNDERSVLKREINLSKDSDLIEEKEYIDYQSENK